MEDSLIVIMFCQVLQTLVIFFFYFVWVWDKRQIKDYTRINIVKDQNADQNKDEQEVIHCGGSPATGWYGECEYGQVKEYFMCFASDIDGVETVGRFKSKEKSDARD